MLVATDSWSLLRPEFVAADVPRILWIELTSKCPFDCVFCSRKALRGAGEHMDFGLYRQIISQLRTPELIRLNYSGESAHYPHLTDAIRLADETGAFTELVSAFASFPADRMEALIGSGLDRLTVSIHTADEAQFERLYRFGSLSQLREKLALFRECQHKMGAKRPVLDFAFVALQENLSQLPSIAEYACELGVRDIFVHPVIRRTDIAARLEGELENNRLRPEFKRDLQATLASVQSRFTTLRVKTSTPELEPGCPLHGRPRRYAGPLPDGARIQTCDQNPWETVHVLANGDVVVCEVQDRTSLGNLGRSSLADIWNGEKYQEFRRLYANGRADDCKDCPYKIAFIPSAMQSAVAPTGAATAQLLSGWHESEGAIVWSKPSSKAVISSPGGKDRFVLRGILPPASGDRENRLTVCCNGSEAGTVVNRSREAESFELSFRVKNSAPIQTIEFSTSRPYRPLDRGLEDVRQLGFALEFMAVEGDDIGRLRSHVRFATLTGALAWGTAVGSLLRSFPRKRTPKRPWKPGITIIIPERSTVGLLEPCLAAAHVAAAQLEESVEFLVVVNGSPAKDYCGLRRQFPAVKWLHSERPLGFQSAVARGLRRATYEWVYLLNSDMTMDSAALRECARCRAAHVFAIASQIFFADPLRRREETGWTDFRLDGQGVEIFDALPESQDTVRGHLYAGGGSSLFQRDLLREMMTEPDPYFPFYWEDVEWGVRAWRSGYEVLFCPRSKVTHVHRATVSQFYGPDEIERIVRRNALQFELRNNLSGARRQIIENIRCADDTTRAELCSIRNAIALVKALCWNARTPERQMPLQYTTRKFYLRPLDPFFRRPRVLVVAPFAVYPPAHGGARRITSLLQHLGHRFDIVFLGDEESAYDGKAVEQFAEPAVVHLIGGRPDDSKQSSNRIARIRTHSHEVLRSETRRLADCYGADLIQIEHIELGALVQERQRAVPWVLTLHDVLFDGKNSSEDCFERDLVSRYSAVIVCSKEDAALLDHPQTIIVPNGAHLNGLCQPSLGRKSLLFVGPFRYSPNLRGIKEFLETTYPRLLQAIPDLKLDILGGHGAQACTRQSECFRQPGIRVHEHVDDLPPWYERCALTINPLYDIRGSSIKVLESLAAGRVCVTTAEGARGLTETPFPSLIRAARIDGFFEPIRALLLDEPSRLRIEAASAEIRAGLCWSRSAALQQELYERHLARR